MSNSTQFSRVTPRFTDSLISAAHSLALHKHCDHHHQEYSGPFALVRLLNISLFHFAPIYQTHSNIECQQQNVNLYRYTQWSCSAAPLSPLSNRDTFLDVEHSFLRRQRGRFGRHKFYAAAIKKIMFSFPGEREIDDKPSLRRNQERERVSKKKTSPIPSLSLSVKQ